MKKCTMVFIDNGDGFHIDGYNEGFSVCELITMLDVKKQDLLNQIMEPTKFTRVAKVDGVDYTIEEVKENSDVQNQTTAEKRD